MARKSARPKLTDLLKFESMLAQLAFRFVDFPADQIDSEIQECQRLICESFGLDRSALFQKIEPSPDKLLLTHLSQPAQPKHLPKSVRAILLSDNEWANLDREIPTSYEHFDAGKLFPWTVERVNRCETVCISKLEDLPECAALDRQSYRGFGTKSTAVVPLIVEGSCIGMLTFASIRSERKWPEHQLQRFRFIADLFASALSRQRADRALERSEHRYRQLFDSASDAIFLVDAATAMILDVNPAAERMYGYSREEFLQFRIIDISAEPEKTSQTVARGERHIPLRWHRRKDGEIFPTEISISHFVDQERRVFIGAVRDITDRRLAQEALRVSEERYRDFIGLTSEGIARFEADEPIDASLPEAEQLELIRRRCRLAECNNAFGRAFGAEKAEDLIGMPLERMLDHIRPYDRELLTSFVRSGYRVEDAESFEVDPRGNPRYFSRSLDGVIEAGRLLRVWLVQHETTRQKLAEEGLRKSERTLRQHKNDLRKLAGKLIYAQEEERRRLARELHDDLSQRLAILAMDTDTLQQELANSAGPLREKIKDLQARILEISKDIHGISRRLHPSIIETLGLAKAITSECRNFAQRENIEVRCDTQPLPERVSSEVALCLFRIVQEGLRNAAKHSGATLVRVRLSADENALRLFVQDDGIGFVPDEGKRGAGLGLVSMDERVHLLQGGVTIDSAPGEGTIINVEVPLGKRLIGV